MCIDVHRLRYVRSKRNKIYVGITFRVEHDADVMLNSRWGYAIYHHAMRNALNIGTWWPG